MSTSFTDKLRILQQHHSLTQAELARLLRTSRAHLNNVQAGRRPVTLDLVVRTAELFGITIDYLLRDNIPIQQVVSPIKESDLNYLSSYDQFGIKLLRLRTQNHLSQTDVARQLDLSSRAYISNLEAGRKIPSLYLIQRIADIFCVTTDYLLKDDIPLIDTE